MNNNYTIVETSKLAAVRGGGHLYSLISDTDIENGSVGYVGDLSESVEGMETHEFGTFDADTLGKKRAVLVANPEWNYDEGSRKNQALNQYINKAGVPFRAYDLEDGGEFMLSAPGFDATGVEAIEKGQYVILAADSTKFKIVATEGETADAAFVGKIEKSVKRGYGWAAKNGSVYGQPYTMYLVHILKNELA